MNDMMHTVPCFTISDIFEFGLLGIYGKSGALYLILTAVFLAAAGYLIGGINTSILYSKLRYGKDIRESGSGNAGLTNMLRTYGKKAAAVTLIGDIAKTALCCLIGAIVFSKTGAAWCGYAAVIGHIWPVWFKFRGGKGVLSIATVVLICEPLVFLIGFTVFFIIVAFTKYISLGSVVCALLLPIIMSRVIGNLNLIIIPTVIVCLIIVWKHRSNIKRLREGNENKVHLGKNGEFVSNKILIPVAALLACASVFAFAMSFRTVYAMTYGKTKLSAAQLRVFFIDEKIKRYAPGEFSDENDDEIMRAAEERAAKTLILRAASAAEKRAVSEEGKKKAEAYFTELSAYYGANKTENADLFVKKTFGAGLSADDVIALIKEEIYAKEYEAAEPEKAGQLLETETGKIKRSEKAITGIIKEY